MAESWHSAQFDVQGEDFRALRREHHRCLRFHALKCSLPSQVSTAKKRRSTTLLSRIMKCCTPVCSTRVTVLAWEFFPIFNVRMRAESTTLLPCLTRNATLTSARICTPIFCRQVARLCSKEMLNAWRRNLHPRWIFQWLLHQSVEVAKCLSRIQRSWIFPVPQSVSKFSSAQDIGYELSVAAAGNVDLLAPFTMKYFSFLTFDFALCCITVYIPHVKKWSWKAKSNNETRVQNAQSCSWLVVWHN